MLKRKILLLMLILFSTASSLYAAEVIQMALCPESEYNKEIYQCQAAPEPLDGEYTIIDSSVHKRVYFLTTIKTEEHIEVYHIWYYMGEGEYKGKRSFYDQKKRAYLDNSEILWISTQKDLTMESALTAVMKLQVAPSEHFRTRSVKKIYPGMWKVEVHSSSANKREPLALFEFMVK